MALPKFHPEGEYNFVFSARLHIWLIHIEGELLGDTFVLIFNFFYEVFKDSSFKYFQFYLNLKLVSKIYGVNTDNKSTITS